jgi:hypothetical protein
MFKEEFALAIAIDVLLIKSHVCLLQVVMGSNILMCSIFGEYKMLNANPHVITLMGGWIKHTQLMPLSSHPN